MATIITLLGHLFPRRLLSRQGAPRNFVKTALIVSPLQIVMVAEVIGAKINGTAGRGCDDRNTKNKKR